MNMENATITDIGNGLFKIVPNEGFVLYNKLANEYFTEAVTWDVTEFVSVRKAE